MGIVIHQFVVHQLSLTEQQTLALLPRKTNIDITPQIEELAQQLHLSFNAKPGKGIGGFVEDSEAEESDVAFVDILKEWQQNPDTFVEFSIKSSERLLKTLLDFGTVETGFVTFCHYQYLATDYILIAVLNTKEHVQVSDSLEVSYSHHLDLSRMQLAARVDLTDYSTTPENNRYISFIKGRAGRKVSDFFLSFLGCDELIDVKQQNKQLVANVDAFLASESLDKEEKQQYREKVSEYYKEKIDSGEDIAVSELSGYLPEGSNEVNFEAFTQQQEQPIEPQLQPDASALKTLQKFSGQGGGISLSFERKLLGDRVKYDIANDRLVIEGLPPNLKDQLSKWQQ
ncbi:nucleoid-associated protein YejK [Alteromonadaceae bacterium M269]|nr:nucleoid-associated protein YejK [Alteromonadaceae bacterium M269]